MNAIEFVRQMTKDTTEADLIPLFGKIDHYDCAAIILLFAAMGCVSVTRLVGKVTNICKAKSSDDVESFVEFNRPLKEMTNEGRDVYLATVHDHIAALAGDRAEELLKLVFYQNNRKEDAKIKVEAVLARRESK